MMRPSLFFIGICAAAMPVLGNTADTVTQYGITWHFDKPYTIGKFANGDWWVLGPVTLTRITPDFDGRHHGCEINPVYANPQGFDVRIHYLASTFDPKLDPAFPLQISGFKSIVKTISIDTSDTSKAPHPIVNIAAVLTVVPEIPPDSGKTVFRPPYVASDKPYYSINDIRTGLLPRFPAISSMPALDSLYNCFKMVQLDHKDGATGASLRPKINVSGSGYAPTMAMFSNDAILRLMMNDPVPQKMDLLIVMLQKGIDMYHCVLNGQTWPDGGGHQPGHVLPMAFAALMLNNQGMKTTVAQSAFFHETRLSCQGTAGQALYGVRDQYWTEKKYWQTLATQSGSNSERDPYGYIDGGYAPGAQDIYLMCCVAQAWKGSALAFQLFPALKTVWNNPSFFSFADRWVEKGTLTQPDPCAPPDGICQGGANDGKPCTLAGGCPGGTCKTSMDNYGKTFGPDSKGGCIKDTDTSDGTGRFPAQNNKNVDGGLRSTPFQGALWQAYRNHPEMGLAVRFPNFRPGRKNAPMNSFVNIIEHFSTITVMNMHGKRICSFPAKSVRDGAWTFWGTGMTNKIGNGLFFFLCENGSQRILLPAIGVR